MNSRLTIIPLLLLLMSAGRAAESEDTLHRDTLLEVDSVGADTTEELKYVLQLNRLTVDDMQLYDTLDLMVESFGNQFAGFTLKLGHYSSYLDILEILPGEVPDSCGWEFFRAVEIDTKGNHSLLPTLWRITALAKMSVSGPKVRCYGFERPASLLRLVVSSAHMMQVPDTTIPVFFFWEDCRDNVLSDASGNLLIVSSAVIDYFPVAWIGIPDMFPTRLGTPLQCIDQGARNRPVRGVEFHNGGVEFKLSIKETGPPDVDTANRME